MDTSKPSNKIIVAFIIVIVLVAASAAIIAITDKNKNATQTEETTTKTQTTDTSGSGTNNAVSESGNYKDGTYNADGSYRTPGGNESIGVQLTLKDGTITDAEVSQNATGGEAEEYQSRFISGFKSEVVGKKIDEVSLSRVAGSSLTPIGFNNAIDTIKSEAKA